MAGRPFALLLLIAGGCSDLPEAAQHARLLPRPLPVVPIPAVAGAASAAPSTAVSPWPAGSRAGAEDNGGQRVYSKVRFLWIHPAPSAGTSWIGYLSLGDSAPLAGGGLAQASAGAGSGSGCSR